MITPPFQNERRNLYRKMNNRFSKKKSRTGFSAKIIGAVIFSFLVFGIVTGVIGFCIFRYSLKKEYDASTRSMALSAAALVNGDRIDDYLGRWDAAGYSSEKALLEAYCRNMDLSRIDVISVDAGENSRCRSVFSTVNPAADYSGEAEMEPAQSFEIQDNEIQQKIRAVYENNSAYETVFHTGFFNGQYDMEAFVPVRDEGGRTVAVLLMQRSVRPLADALLYYMVSILAAALIFAGIESWLSSRYVRKQFVRPVEQISAEVVRFANENTMCRPLGNISSIDELSSLAGSVDILEVKMTNYINDLTAATAEKERIRTEMDLAEKIQNSQIPGKFPAFPDRNEFDVYGSMTPARMIGGDFYNFILIDEDHLALWVGDVSGKGVPAALFMMSVNLMLSARVRFAGSPAEMLADVNNRICDNNTTGMFVTVWLGILELSTGKLTAANGGHEYPVICRNNRFDLLKDKHGLVLGGLYNSKYADYMIDLAPGDRVFVYSDGVPEARNSSQEMFQSARLIESLNRNRNGSVEEIIWAVKTDIDAFVGGAPQFDDITMLLFEYKG